MERVQSVHYELHAELETLSPNAKQVMAEESDRHIHVDQPQSVIDAIRQVVAAARHETGTFNTV